MAKFYGKIGYATTVDKGNGVWVEEITEYDAYGDVTRNALQLQAEEKVNNDLRLQNSISIVADAYAREHFFAIRYVKWAGARWVVTQVTVESPRLLLRLGGVYNGEIPIGAE